MTNLLKTLSFALLVIAISFFFTHVANSEGEELFTVATVIDGDTIVLANNQKVRLIGVSAPEIEDSDKKIEKNKFLAVKNEINYRTVKKYSEKSKEFLKNMIEGKKVKVLLDPEKEKIAHKDKQEKMHAYVYRASDDLFINAEIIKQGYGAMNDCYWFKYYAEFRQYEKEAKKDKKGLWSKFPVDK